MRGLARVPCLNEFYRIPTICGPSARRAAASFAAAAARSLSIPRLLKPMADLTLGRGNRSMPLHFGHVLAAPTMTWWDFAAWFLLGILAACIAAIFWFGLGNVLM